uniref:Putative secreted protein n=1 Tax=Ixodes ricinus TaxID=34613 RepID=A0A6B0TUA2_IXORI
MCFVCVGFLFTPVPSLTAVLRGRASLVFLQPFVTSASKSINQLSRIVRRALPGSRPPGAMSGDGGGVKRQKKCAEA